jgi:anti-sigma regulatory factor (Ser/Thr protein kinase)
MRREVILPADHSAAILARRALNEAIPPPILDERFDDARLAISELATNAVRHGQLRPDMESIRLVIEADDEHLLVEVEQPTSAVTAAPVGPRTDTDGQMSGFGLPIVAEVADAWGVVAGPPGIVWFEFRRPTVR